MKAKQDGNRMFDIVILDINMPMMDGIEAVKKIVKLFEHEKPIFMPKFVAVTSHVTDAIEKECLDSGFDEVRLAPLTFLQIKNELMPSLIQRRREIGRQERINERIQSMIES